MNKRTEVKRIILGDGTTIVSSTAAAFPSPVSPTGHGLKGPAQACSMRIAATQRRHAPLLIVTDGEHMIRSAERLETLMPRFYGGDGA